MAKTIFITDASRGFGKIWTEVFLQCRDNVVAAVDNAETLIQLTTEFPSNLLVLKLSFLDSENLPRLLL